MQTVTMTLTEFLLARIAEDEVDGPRHPDSCAAVVSDERPCDCDGAARVLAECDAKRRIVEHAANDVDAGFEAWDAGVYARFVLGTLALPYADHPDYQEIWKP